MQITLAVDSWRWLGVLQIVTLAGCATMEPLVTVTREQGVRLAEAQQLCGSGVGSVRRGQPGA